MTATSPGFGSSAAHVHAALDLLLFPDAERVQGMTFLQLVAYYAQFDNAWRTRQLQVAARDATAGPR